MPKATGSRAARAKTTRDAIIKAARSLFGKAGYHSASTPEIVQLAGVSRGALQHHFPMKEDLFLAVFHDVQQDLMQRAAATPVTSPEAGELWSSFLRNLDTFMAGVSSSEIQKILLIDGPVVLGWSRWRDLDAHYGLPSIIDAIEDGIAAGQVRQQPSKPLAHLILALIHETALLIANDDSENGTHAEAREALKHLLNSLG